MELDTAALAGFRTKYDSIFNAAFNLAEPKFQCIAAVVDSAGFGQITHRWLRGLQGMREFTDSRVLNNLDTDGFTVRNKAWEDTITIDRADLERDQWRIYEPTIQRLAQVAKLHRDVLSFGQLSAALATPSSAIAYDGLPFFGTHNVKRAVPFTNVTTAHLSFESLRAAIADLRNRRDSAGFPLLASSNVKPIVVCPPQLSLLVEQLENATFFPMTQPNSGASSGTNQAAAGVNTLQGAFTHEYSPFLQTATEWHVVLPDALFKPVIFQIEREIETLPWEQFIAQWAMNAKFVYGVYARYNVGVGLPEMVFSSTGVA